MAERGNPWDIPEWRALSRECSLVRHLIGSGATALAKANYADQTGEYYTAFFGLSVGLERLAKLILVVDHALSNDGRLPQPSDIARYGHKLAHLMDEVEKMQEKHSISLSFSRPATDISKRIIECLDVFADARRGRYANFATLGDPNLGEEFEPIRKWWTDVAEAVLKEHYYGKPVQKKVEGNALLVDAMVAKHSMVLHINEEGKAIQDVRTASARTGQTELVQKFGRYYALTVVRWLSELFSNAASIACYDRKFPAFFGHEEFFAVYRISDALLKSKKKWP